ncbi:MAG TPA: phenylalanine--tRNA ligase subunit beta [bacterium]|nr:phenylalanine--tRNA ligase subunit beta [bacterium]
MRLSFDWLREYVDIDVPLEALVERLPSIGLPVEQVERVGNDAVLEIDLTSNRPDCMSILGIAREVALLLGRPLRVPVSKPVEHAPAASTRVAVAVADPEGCPRFTARVIEEVRIGPSPAWAQRRLEASGIRAINNVVDATNYVMLELGQPMHAFDYDRIAGHRLVVRRAEPGERLTTLDGVARTLDPEMLVVADARRAVALAGVIGGGETEINRSTTRVLLEAAYWNPPAIGRTARRLGLRTEASARFERGMDPAGPPGAQRRAAQFLAEWCGGRVLRGVVDVYPRTLGKRAIRLRSKRAVAMLGVDVPRTEMRRILRALGCRVTPGAILEVRPPSFRPDLLREEDLIEEVARIYGYDRVPPTMPRGETTPGAIAPVLRIDARVRETLARSGLTEVLTLTLVSRETGARGGAAPVVLQNPLTTDQAVLRTSLLPGLVAVLATNAARRAENVHAFELGRVFRAGAAGGRPEERRALGIAVMGRWRSGWNIPADQAVADFFHLKGIIEGLLEELGVGGVAVGPSPDAAAGWWHPGRAAALVSGGTTIGRLGELHPDLATAHRLPSRAYLAEVDLEALLPVVALERASPDLPRYPAVERDVAAVIPEGLPAGQVEAAIRAAAGPLLEAVELFDVYTGPPVPAAHRNLAYRLRLRAPDRTLTAEEAEEIVQQVRIALEEQVGVRLRE